MCVLCLTAFSYFEMANPRVWDGSIQVISKIINIKTVMYSFCLLRKVILTRFIIFHSGISLSTGFRWSKVFILFCYPSFISPSCIPHLLKMSARDLFYAVEIHRGIRGGACTQEPYSPVRETKYESEIIHYYSSLFIECYTIKDDST